MNIHIVKNRYLNAFLVLLLITAVAHFIILAFEVIFGGNPHLLNLIRILEINRYFPFFDSLAGDIISFVLAGVLYVAILKISKR